MRYLKYAFWVLVILIVVGFSGLNSHLIEVNYYLSTVKIYFPMLLLMIMLLGAAFGILAMLPLVMKAKQRARQFKKQMKRVEKEVTNLRHIPIKGER